MSLFETTQMLEQLPVPRDDAHQQVVPGRSNPYSRPEFSMAILMKRAGDEGRGARYLEVAKNGGACPELEMAREAFGEASAADAEPDGVTRIVGSRVPKVLRTPRVDDLVDEARE